MACIGAVFIIEIMQMSYFLNDMEGGAWKKRDLSDFFNQAGKILG